MSTELARKLRKRMSPAEARLWNLLRGEPFKQFHFRRQVPIGSFYADFASHAAKLIIEVDGDTHGTSQAIAADARRTAFIASEGYTVVRFSNRDVMNNLDGVGTDLIAELAAAPTRPLTGPPSPQGGGRTATPVENVEA